MQQVQIPGQSPPPSCIFQPPLHLLHYLVQQSNLEFSIQPVTNQQLVQQCPRSTVKNGQILHFSNQLVHALVRSVPDSTEAKNLIISLSILYLKVKQLPTDTLVDFESQHLSGSKKKAECSNQGQGKSGSTLLGGGSCLGKCQISLLLQLEIKVRFFWHCPNNV